MKETTMFNIPAFRQMGVAAITTLAATAALAHPSLIDSTPKDNSEGPAPAKIELRFSEKLTRQFSKANLVMTKMPGMASHGPMKMAAKVGMADDPKVMVLTPNQALAPGKYSVEWRAVSADTHPVNGKITFTVK